VIHLADLDYSAIEGKSPLHRLSARVKVAGLLCVLAGVVLVHDVPALAVLYGALVACFLAARIPKRIFPLTLYPLLFAVIFIFVSGFQVRFILMVFFKVLCGSTGVIVLLATTPYPRIFRVLERFLPALLVTALLLTYRSVFLLLKVLEETEHALYLRGGINWRHPWRGIENLANAFGHLILKGIDGSEKMYEGMMIRGFGDRRIRRK
jgi:cobalt/nickel transport system permease protein